MLLFKGLWIIKADEQCKCVLMGHTSMNMKNSSAECDLNCGCFDQEVSKEKNVSMCP